MCGSRPRVLAHHVAPCVVGAPPSHGRARMFQATIRDSIPAIDAAFCRSCPCLRDSDRASLPFALHIQDLYRAEGSRACKLVIHNREGITCAESDGCLLQLVSGSGPWAVDGFGGKCR